MWLLSWSAWAHAASGRRHVRRDPASGFECPPLNNPADFMFDVLVGNADALGAKFAAEGVPEDKGRAARQLPEERGRAQDEERREGGASVTEMLPGTATTTALASSRAPSFTVEAQRTTGLGKARS